MRLAALILTAIGLMQMPQGGITGPPPAGGGSAPVFQMQSYSNATTANCNPGEPSGTVQGDVLIGELLVTGSSTTATVPTGWTSLYTGTSDSTTFKWAVGYIIRGSSAADTAFHNDAVYRECSILRISGANGTTPIDSQSANGISANSSATPDAPSTTATTACNTGLCLAVTGGEHWTGSGASGWCVANYTIRSNNTAGNDLFLATRTSAVSAGSIDPTQSFNGGSGSSCAGGTNTVSSGAAYWNGFTITLKP